MSIAINERGSNGKAHTRIYRYLINYCHYLRNALFTWSDRICMYFLHIIYMI